MTKPHQTGAGSVLAAGLLVLLTASCAAPQADVVVEHMDVAVTVLADGSARVDEQLTVRFGGTSVSSFRRQTPAWRHDGVSEITATMDGARVDPGAGSGRLQIEGTDALDVQWTFPSAANVRRQFTLAYRAANAIGISGIRGTLSWLAVPPARPYDIAEVTVRVTLPESAILLQDPWVEEAGWDVVRLPHGLKASRANVARAESGTVGVEFTIDKMNLLKPRWQFDASRAREFMPAFVSAGLFIFVIGAGVLAMLRLKHPPTKDKAVDPELLAAARDLRRTAWVVLLAGVLAWIAVSRTLQQFDIWPLAIPGSMLIVGVMFLAGAAYFRRP